MRECKTLSVHSYESFGSVDGPGIRFIVFLKGCAMRCAYCHNPDTWSREGAEEWTVADVLDRAERYRAYWGSKGGITVSGGEPLLQAEAVTELFREAHRRGINTCIDTSAQPYRPGATFDDLFHECDTVLLDIKHIDDDAHKKLTGHTNQNILACAQRLAELNVPVWIRHVLVPGITDDDEALKRLRQFIDTLPNVKRVDVLPYHTMGRFKWQNLGIPYTLEDTNPPTAERIENARRILTL